jgi:hypothetical protein
MDKTTYTDNGNGSGTLTLYNAQGQSLDSITFAGSYQLANFTIEDDGSGHTLIVDPPVRSGTSTIGSGTASPSVSVGGAGNDNFLFQPSHGAHNGNSSSESDAPASGQFTAAEIQQWLIGNNEHAAAFTDPVHHGDSATPSDMIGGYLQSHLQSLAHLH